MKRRKKGSISKDPLDEFLAGQGMLAAATS
jgi:hypothetical protein